VKTAKIAKNVLTARIVADVSMGLTACIVKIAIHHVNVWTVKTVKGVMIVPTVKGAMIVPAVKTAKTAKIAKIVLTANIVSLAAIYQGASI
jgi:hypothetical protein